MVFSAYDACKQVADLAVWSTLGVACGIYSDTAAWNSVHALPGPLSFLLLLLKSGGPGLASLLFVPSFFVGSRVRVVGLSGGIASGKSTATACIRAMGVPVVDADEISHRVLQKNTPAYWRVRKAFADFAIVQEDGSIDRAALRSLVVGDKELNRRLKQCTHAAIAYELFSSVWRESLLRRRAVVVLDAPLLFETKLNLLCKHVILVHVPPEVQLARLHARDQTPLSECRKALEWQLPTAVKLAKSDLPLDNSGTIDNLQRAITAHVTQLQREAAAHPCALLLS